MREGQTAARKRARRLRTNMPVAEQLLWQRLRRRQVHGFRFRRQHPVGPFIADFACLETRLIVEVDGATHGRESEVDHDQRRTQYLNAQGWRVVRVWNREIYRDLDGVVEGIAMSLPPPRPAGGPPPPGGGGIR